MDSKHGLFVGKSSTEKSGQECSQKKIYLHIYVYRLEVGLDDL